MRAKHMLSASLVTAMVVLFAGSAAAQDDVAFQGSDAIQVSVPRGSRAEIALVNPTASDVSLFWGVEFREGSGEVTPNSTVVPANSVEHFALAISEVPGRGALDGVLVGRDGADDTGQIRLTRGIVVANPDLLFVPQPWLIVGLAVIIGAGIVLLSYLRRTYPDIGIRNSKFDFSKSWASTLTAVGALLATVAASGFLPETSAVLTKETVAALSVMFAALVLLGPIFYAAAASPGEPRDGVPTRGSTIWSFHVASAATAIAVIGQLTLLAVLIIEAFSLSEVAWVISGIVLFLTLAAWALVAWYVWGSIPKAIEDGQKGEQGETQRPSARVLTLDVRQRAASEGADGEPPQVAVRVEEPSSAYFL